MISFGTFLQRKQLITMIISYLISAALEPIIDTLNSKLIPKKIKDKYPVISQVINFLMVLLISFILFQVKT